MNRFVRLHASTLLLIAAFFATLWGFLLLSIHTPYDGFAHRFADTLAALAFFGTAWVCVRTAILLAFHNRSL